MQKPLLLIVALIILSVGCARRKIENKFYLIEPVKATQVSSDQQPFGLYCQIAPVEIAPAFASNKIVHRNEQYQISYYTNHQWAVVPDIMLMEVIEEDLRRQRLFKEVGQRLRSQAADFVLLTEIHQMETLEVEKKDLAAHLNLTMRLLDTNTETVALEHRADRQVKLDRNDLNLFAAAISTLLEEELAAFAEEVKELISE